MKLFKLGFIYAALLLFVPQVLAEESNNFVLHGAKNVKALEWWRIKIHNELFGEDPPKKWPFKCHFYVYKDINVAKKDSRYGPSANKSYGLTRCTLVDDELREIEIHIRMDAPDWENTVLPHEIAHAILRFKYGVIPVYIDEGVAMYAESSKSIATRISKITKNMLDKNVEDVFNRREYHSDVNANLDAYYVGLYVVKVLVADQKKFQNFLKKGGTSIAFRESYGMSTKELAEKLKKELPTRE